MKNESKTTPDLKRKGGWVTVGLLLAMSIFGIFRLTTTRASPPAQLSDQVLTAGAIAVAKSYGLEGEPEAYRSMRMTLAEFLAIAGGGLGTGAAKFGLTPDMPVFVLAIRGKIIYRGPGLPRPDQTEPDTSDNLIIAIDARTGNMVRVQGARPDTSPYNLLPSVTATRVPTMTPSPTPFPTPIPLPLRPTPTPDRRPYP